MFFFDPLEHARTLSIMPTYQCTAQCTHCGTLSSPFVKTRLDQQSVLNAIDEAADNGYKVVVFTGGEATLARKVILAGIEKAKSRGLLVRLVTNAQWAVNDQAAKQRVNEFVQAGLHEINFSTGDEHIRFVPLERIVIATRAAV